MNKKILVYGKKFLFLFFIYILLFSVFSLTSNHLKTEELNAVVELYEEMNEVKNDLKSNFYVHKILKYVNKDFVVEELHRDTLLYSIEINNKLLGLLNIYNRTQLENFINNCNLDFEKFVGLETPIKLFEEYKRFIKLNSLDIDDLVEFQKNFDTIVVNEYNYIQSFTRTRNLKISIVIFSYLFIGFVWCYKSEKSKKRSEKK